VGEKETNQQSDMKKREDGKGGRRGYWFKILKKKKSAGEVRP